MADAPHGGWSAEHNALAVAAGFESWAAWILAVEAKRGRAICGRRNRQQRPCGKFAGGPSRKGKQTDHPGQGACGDHGGLSLAGPEHPEWVDGQHAKASKYRLHGRIAEAHARLEALVSDAFDLSAEARIADSQLVVLQESMVDGGYVTGADLAGVAGAIKAAVDAGDAEGLKAAFSGLDELAAKAKRGDRVWKEWVRLVELKRRLADTNARQLAREFGPVRLNDVQFLIEQWKMIALRFIPREQLGAFAKAISDASSSANMGRVHDA